MLDRSNWKNIMAINWKTLTFYDADNGALSYKDNPTLFADLMVEFLITGEAKGWVLLDENDYEVKPDQIGPSPRQ